MPAAPPDGFAEFVATRSSALHRVAWLLTSDESKAEDLLQTALAVGWRRWGDIADGNPEAYLRKVLYTTYVTWWRRRWRGEHPTADLPDAPGHEFTAAHADRDAVVRALGRLSRQQRAVLVLRYFEDKSVAETAEFLGCSRESVKVQSSRALAKLRRDPHLETFRTGSPTAGPTSGRGER
ncbi:MAG TPA: SigE family RNA polymerase sigma factor [Micromonosporaceae bacterium]|jgi:RNA polymerase sigma-70 factor (sigma-E family)